MSDNISIGSDATNVEEYPHYITSQDEYNDLLDFLRLALCFDHEKISEVYFKTFYESANYPEWMNLFETRSSWDTFKFAQLLYRLQENDDGMVKILNDAPHEHQFAICTNTNTALEKSVTNRNETPYAIEFMKILTHFIQVKGADSGADARKETLTHISSCIELHQRLFSGGMRGLQASPDSAMCLGMFMENHFMYSEAKMLYEWAVHARGLNHMLSWDSVNALAGIQNQLGNYSTAVELLNLLVRDQEQTLGAQHPAIMQALENLANAYCNQGQYDRSKNIYHRILELIPLNAPPSARHLTQGNLGILYCFQGKFDMAEQLFRRICAEQEHQQESMSDNVLAAKHNLATLCLERGKIAEASIIFHEMLQILTDGFEHRNPKVFKIRRSLALMYSGQNKKVLARAMLEMVRTDQQKTLGKYHPDTLGTIDALACFLADERQYDEAKVLFDEVLGCSEQARGPKHPYTLSMKFHLANMYQAQNLLREAEHLYREVWQARDEILGREHPATRIAKECLDRYA